MQASVNSLRIDQISRATAEMARCRECYKEYPKDKFAIFMGEMDWMAELSRLVHDTEEGSAE